MKVKRRKNLLEEVKLGLISPAEYHKQVVIIENGGNAPPLAKYSPLPDKETEQDDGKLPDDAWYFLFYSSNSALPSIPFLYLIYHLSFFLFIFIMSIGFDDLWLFVYRD